MAVLRCSVFLCAHSLYAVVCCLRVFYCTFSWVSCVFYVKPCCCAWRVFCCVCFCMLSCCHPLDIYFFILFCCDCVEEFAANFMLLFCVWRTFCCGLCLCVHGVGLCCCLLQNFMLLFAVCLVLWVLVVCLLTCVTGLLLRIWLACAKVLLDGMWRAPAVGAACVCQRYGVSLPLRQFSVAVQSVLVHCIRCI